MIGLKLRLTMNYQTTPLSLLGGVPNEEAENQVKKSLAVGKRLAYFY